jgi:prophage regulatory protein
LAGFFHFGPNMPKKRFLKLPELPGLTGISQTTIQRLVKRGEFPAPLRLSARRVAWPTTAVADWLDQRAREAENAR